MKWLNMAKIELVYNTSERFNWVRELRKLISLGMVIILLLFNERTVKFFSTHISGGTISILKKNRNRNKCIKPNNV